MTATLPSRIKGPQKILKQLRTLHGQTWKVRQRNERAVLRAHTPEEHRWCGRVGDRLDPFLGDLMELIREGDAVLPAHMDPRDQRRVRKRKQA